MCLGCRAPDSPGAFCLYHQPSCWHAATLSVFGRMLTGFHPNAAGLHQKRPVEPERYDSGPPYCSGAHDLVSGWIPGKMLTPALMAGIKKPNDLFRQRIRGCDAISFVIITVHTSQPEVVFLGFAPTRFWDEMLNGKQHAAHPPGGKAIATAVARLLSNALTQGLRHIGFAHGCSKNGRTSCPRSWSSPIACARTSRVLSCS